LLFFGVHLPWATSQMATQYFAAFSTYLDQGVMSATTAAICWHLRALAPGKWGKPVFTATAILCLANVLFVLIGRSGHVAAIVLLSLAAMWELPKRYRWAVLVLPVVLLAAAVSLSPKVQARAMVMKNEIQTFSFAEGVQVTSSSSSGLRLHFWHRSVESIAQSPVLGSGVGSWSNEYNRIEKTYKSNIIEVNKRGNPHQEYLLWGVQLGIPGILLFLGLLVAIFRDTQGADKASARAAQSVLAALVVTCLFNSSIYDALIGDFFCVALGLTLALVSYKATPESDPNSVAS
jgi:O-antigen ligase